MLQRDEKSNLRFSDVCGAFGKVNIDFGPSRSRRLLLGKLEPRVTLHTWPGPPLLPLPPVLPPSAAAMKECDALNSLEEILSLDVADSQFVWSPPNASGAAIAAQTALHVLAASNSGNGFCDVSGSPDR